MTSKKRDEPILTLAQVKEWQDQAAELTEKISEMQAQVADITRKLEAAKIIIGSLPPHPQTGTKPGPAPAPEAESLPEAVLTAIDALGNLPDPSAIREWILKEKPALRAKLKQSPNYFYTVLLRHVQKNRLIREGRGYRRSNASPQRETGAVAAPAVVTH